MSLIDRSTVRPGLLVSMRTSISGNMKYRSEELEDKRTRGGTHITKWETTRTVFDADEYARAVKVRSKVRGLITSVCIESPFGLLCPNDRAERLEESVNAARAFTDSFNLNAKFTLIRFNIISGRIADNDEEAYRAISGEVRELMRSMEKGIENLDAKAIRDAAYRARTMGQMLTPVAQERVREAIDMARAAARKYAKAGDAAAQEVDREAIAAIASRRTAFLDLDDMDEMQAPAAPGRAVDFDPAGAKQQKPRRRAGIEMADLEEKPRPRERIRMPTKRIEL